jgi:hypothetical protein
MNTTQIFNSIFKKDISAEGNEAFLQQLTQEHPYFSAAQFFLLNQTNTQSEAYKSLAAKTSLHFNNPLWLNYLLNQQQEIAEEPLQNNIATVMQNQKKIAEEELNKAEIVQVPIPSVTSGCRPLSASDTTMLNSTTEASEQKETPVEPKNTLSAEQMLFEPMHMVDYFASQGIKLSEEALQTDKLGKQLKSFTEWLKTMKKVHPEKVMAIAQQTEVLVQNLAEKSNVEDDVLTEAMAEVFAMQGKNNKAIEVYEKLSLLNPLKSAYFAAKILPLKG